MSVIYNALQKTQVSLQKQKIQAGTAPINEKASRGDIFVLALAIFLVMFSVASVSNYVLHRTPVVRTH